MCVVIKTQEINFGTEIETLNVNNDVYFISVLFMVDLHVGVCDCLHLGSLGMFVQVKRLTVPIKVMNER
jgi:hypothetical protein